MSNRVSIGGIRSFSVAERVQLVEEIWDSIADEPESWTLSPSQQAELKRRSTAHDAAPQEGSSWDEVKAGLRTRSGTSHC